MTSLPSTWYTRSLLVLLIAWAIIQAHKDHNHRLVHLVLDGLNHSLHCLSSWPPSSFPLSTFLSIATIIFPRLSQLLPHFLCIRVLVNVITDPDPEIHLQLEDQPLHNHCLTTHQPLSGGPKNKRYWDNHGPIISWHWPFLLRYLRRKLLLIYWKNKNFQVEEQPNMLVAWVGGLAAETVDSLADDQIIDCIGHLVRYALKREIKWKRPVAE